MTTLDKVLAALGGHNLKEEGQGRWRCNSPLRADSDSMAFNLTASDGEHGAFKDHVTGDSGSLYALCGLLDIEIDDPPGPIPVANSKRAYTGLTDYESQKGVPKGTFAAAGWREVVMQQRAAIEIPTACGKRWRFLDGEKPIFKSEVGYHPCWYGLDRAIGFADKYRQPLTICNGEPSTIVAQHFQIAAAAITSGEKDAIPDALLAELKQKYSGVIRIALDCDLTGRKCAGGIAAQLRQAGYQVKVVDLNLGNHGDLADLCKLHGNQTSLILDGLAGAPEPPPTPSKRTWSILTLAELRSLPSISWLIDKVIPMSGLITLYGASGEGKSFYALDVSLTIARTRPVVYVASEGELGYRKRIAAWLAHHHLVEADVNFRIVVGSLSLMDETDLAEFTDELTEGHHPALIVVDTVAMTMTGADENSSRDMGIYIRSCKSIMRSLGTAVMLVHHTGKSGFDERGSSALRGACDVMIRLAAEDDRVKIECTKTKDEQPFPTRYVRLLPVLVEGVGESVVVVPADEVINRPDDQLTDKQVAVLSALNMSLYGESGAVRSDIEESVQMRGGTFSRVMSQLIDLGLVEKKDRGFYAITPSGIGRLTKTPPNDHANDHAPKAEPYEANEAIDHLTTKNRDSENRGESNPRDHGGQMVKSESDTFVVPGKGLFGFPPERKPPNSYEQGA